MSVIKDILQAIWLSFLSTIWTLVGVGVVYLWLGIGALLNNPSLGLFGLLLAIFPVPIILFAYINHILWGKSDSNQPPWIASNSSMHEATWQWFIASTTSIVVFIMMVGVVMVTHPANFYDYPYRYRYRNYDRFYEQIAVYLSLVWYVIATLMFRWKRLWAKKAANKQIRKAEVKKINHEQSVKQTLALTIDEELEQLKQTMKKKDI
ncbi:MAG: hypothetical protein ACKN9E_02960 [Microcystaceae cyanobacterium]